MPSRDTCYRSSNGGSLPTATEETLMHRDTHQTGGDTPLHADRLPHETSTTIGEPMETTAIGLTTYTVIEVDPTCDQVHEARETYGDVESVAGSVTGEKTAYTVEESPHATLAEVRYLKSTVRPLESLTVLYLELWKSFVSSVHNRHLRSEHTRLICRSKLYLPGHCVYFQGRSRVLFRRASAKEQCARI
jgi:hypothetical protein